MHLGLTFICIDVKEYALVMQKKINCPIRAVDFSLHCVNLTVLPEDVRNRKVYIFLSRVSSCIMFILVIPCSQDWRDVKFQNLLSEHYEHPRHLFPDVACSHDIIKLCIFDTQRSHDINLCILDILCPHDIIKLCIHDILFSHDKIMNP